jgi:glutamyl-tRNA synthetase
LVNQPPTQEQAELLAAALPALQTRMRRLTDAVTLLGFLFIPDERFAVDAVDAAKTLLPDTPQQLKAAASALGALASWDREAIEAALRAALVEGLGLKPKLAFTPLYVAVTGRRVGLPIFDSLALLGRDRSLSRLDAAAQYVPIG